MRKNIITGLDIGTSKVCAMIAQVKEKGKLHLLGAGVSAPSGLYRGVVSDLDKLTDSIASALAMAEEKAKLKSHTLIVNVGGPSVKGVSCEGVISFSSVPRGVTKRDVNRVIGVARDLSISLGEDPIHLIPLGYAVDNQDGIENPLGLHGVRLKVRLYIVTCATSLIRNIKKSVNHAGYEIKDIVYSGIATSGVLSEEEISDGMVLIDMGARVTELVVFFKGKINFNMNLNLGGDDITEEISKQFKIPARIAEDLKIRYGTIHEMDLNIDERIVVDVDQRRVIIDRSSMNYLISSKFKEIFSALKKGLEKSGFQHLPAGVVMTGSPLLMSGVMETAEKEFSLPVRMLKASGITGAGALASNPAYTASIGLLIYGLDKYTRPGSRVYRRENLIEKAVFRLKEILTDYF